MAFESTAINDLIAGLQQKPLPRESDDWLFGDGDDAMAIDPRIGEIPSLPRPHGQASVRGASLPALALNLPALPALDDPFRPLRNPTAHTRIPDWAGIAKKLAMPIAVLSIVIVGLGIYFAKTNDSPGQLAPTQSAAAPAAVTAEPTQVVTAIAEEMKPAAAAKARGAQAAGANAGDAATKPDVRDVTVEAKVEEIKLEAKAVEVEVAAAVDKVDRNPEANAEVSAQAKAVATIEPTIVAKAAAKIGPTIEAKPDAKAATTIGLTIEAKPDAKAAATAEAKARATVEAKARAMTQPYAPAMTAAKIEPTVETKLNVAPGSPASRFLTPAPIETTIRPATAKPLPAPSAVADMPVARPASAKPVSASSAAKKSVRLVRADRRAATQRAAQASTARAKRSVAGAKDDDAADAPAARPTTRAATGKGILSIASRPAMEVWVNGRNSNAMTPVRIRLLAGKHKVTLFDKQNATAKSFEIVVKPDETTTVSKNYQ